MSARQPGAVLRQADEIKVQYKDIDYLFNLIENYPSKRLVVEIGPAEEVEDSTWDLLAAHNEKIKNNLYICLYTYDHVKKCRERKLKYYYGTPADTMYKLRAFKDIGCSFAIVEAPLAFDLDSAKSMKMKLRMIPNMAITDNLPRKNGLHGAWVRPEDIGAYEEYIDTFEFRSRDAQQERGYFAIYKDGFWNDDLNLLITGLNVSVPNYVINSEQIVPKRLRCKQRCELNDLCRACDTYFTFVNKAKEYEDRRQEIIKRYESKPT